MTLDELNLINNYLEWIDDVTEVCDDKNCGCQGREKALAIIKREIALKTIDVTKND